MTIRLLLPFLCLKCKGFNPKTSFPQHGDSEGVDTGNCPRFYLIISQFIGNPNRQGLPAIYISVFVDLKFLDRILEPNLNFLF